MITYDYKYTEIELAYADFESDEIVNATIQIPGHRKARNKKLIKHELEKLGINANEYTIKQISFKEKQYAMDEEIFMKYAYESLM